MDDVAVLSPLAIIAFSALVQWTPLEEHAFYEPRARTEERYAAVAEDIASVVTEATGPRIEDAELEVLLLASIASAESHLARDVDECRRGLGNAWSIFQIAGGRERRRSNVCSSRREAARVALAMVRESFDVCAARARLDRLSFYTDGRCERGWPRSRYRVHRAVAAWRAWRALRERPDPSRS